MKRNRIAWLLALLLCVVLTMPVFAADTDAEQTETLPPMTLIHDEGDVLKDSEEQELEQLAQKVYELTKMPVGYASLPEQTEDSLFDEAKRYYNESIDPEGKAESALFIVDNLDTGKFVLYSKGSVRDLLTENDNEVYNTITDAYADNSDYAGGIEAFLRSTYAALTGFDLQDALDFQPVEREKALVVDEASVLTDQEMSTLNERAERLSEENQMETAVVFVKDIGDKTAQEFADDYYDYNGYGWGENDDGILLMVATESRDYALTTHGAAIAKFTDAHLEMIEDEILSYLGDNQWAFAAREYLLTCERIYNGEEPQAPSLLRFNPLYLLLGLLLAAVPMSRHKKALQTAHSGGSAASYEENGGIVLTRKEDTFLNKTIHRERIEKESSSSGSSHSSRSSSTHSSSSGRTHGGRSGKF